MATTFKSGSTLDTGTSSSPAFTITFNPSAPLPPGSWAMFDHLGAPCTQIGNDLNKVAEQFGDKFCVAGAGSNAAQLGFDGRAGRTSPAGIFFPNTKSSGPGATMYSGSGLPTAVIASPCAVGDIYARIDTPGTANQNVYHCTTAGSPGTWTPRK